MGRPWRLDLDAVAVRPVRRAGLLLFIGETAIVLDADDGGFARLDLAAPPDGFVNPLALSPDGTRLVAWSVEDNGRTVLLVLHTLATRLQQRFRPPADGLDRLAAISPDGRVLAAFAQGADSGSIDLVDIETHIRRRLWTGDGGPSINGAAIAWSPDGRRIAATYYFTPIDDLATVVIDTADGAVIGHYERQVAFDCANGAWADDHHLVLTDEPSDEHPPPDHLVDVRGGPSRRLHRAPGWRYPMALVGGRLLNRSDDGLWLTNPDGNDPEPFLTVAADVDIRTFDVAPGALG